MSFQRRQPAGLIVRIYIFQENLMNIKVLMIFAKDFTIERPTPTTPSLGVFSITKKKVKISSLNINSKVILSKRVF